MVAETSGTWIAPCGRLKIYILLPLENGTPQLFHEIRMSGSKIVALTRVRTHIEEKRLQAIDEKFPVALAHSFLQAVSGVGAPEQRALLGRLATLEHGEQIYAFVPNVMRHRCVGSSKNGGGQVHGDAYLAGYLPRGDAGRPPDDGRHANAAFP